METEKKQETIRFWVNGEELLVPDSSKVSDLLKKDAKIVMPCGGNHICGKCKVFANGNFPAPTKQELSLLGEENYKKGMRLACFLKAVDGGEIRTEKAFGQEEAQGKICLDAAEDSLKEDTGESGKNALYQHLGAAVDIGTTTLAASLFRDGKKAAGQGEWNPQAAFGADVISRMEASLSGSSKELADVVRKAIGQLLEKLAAQADARVEEIETVVITGNTSMLYFLTGRNPESLSHSPFEADCLFGEWMRGGDLSLPCKDARVYLPPCISAFVGADITTALLAEDVCTGTEKKMMVDIGTNGEIALFLDGKISCCSTAAGPAFEGAGLSMGMRGVNGAIDHVRWENDTWKFHVIGDGPSRGICGSGVIDGVAGLLDSEIMDETGYMKEEEILFDGRNGLTRKDIRQVQLAKSAIRAGIETMFYTAKIGKDDLDQFLIAGGFGAYMSVENAQKIGLIPGIPREKIKVCGNAALAGAEKILGSADKLEEAKALAASAATWNLGGDQVFQDYYMENMFFEPSDEAD